MQETGGLGSKRQRERERGVGWEGGDRGGNGEEGKGGRAGAIAGSFLSASERTGEIFKVSRGFS